MTLHIKLTHLMVGIVLGALLAGGGYALATTSNTVVRACVNTRTRAVTVPAGGHCGKGSTALAWNRQGVRGATGATGERGVAGAAGSSGTPATVSVGTVTTGTPGRQATVSNSGTGSNAILNFSIPQGQAGSASSEPVAYGQIWMGSGTGADGARLAPQSHNVAGVGGGDGGAVVQIQGCSTTGLTNPVISVTADRDPSNPLPAGDDPNNTTNVASAYVTGWSADAQTGTRCRRGDV